MNAHKGFSLFELMIVVAMAMILISVTTFNIRFLNRIILASELNLLHSTCYYLQQMAIATNQAQELIFDISNNSYSANGNTHKLPSKLYFGITSQAKGPPSSPNNTLQEPITFADNTITFSSDGIISAGTAYLTDSNALYAISSSVAHVSHLRTYYYDGKWHAL